MSKLNTGSVIASLNAVYTAKYQALLKVGRQYCYRWRRSTKLEAAELIHEAYIKMHCRGGATYQGVKHIFRLTSRIMGQTIYTHAFSQKAEKRGGEAQHVSLSEMEEIGTKVSYMFEDKILIRLSLESALEQLQTYDKLLKDVVTYRYLHDYSVADTAKILKVSEATVKRKCAKGLAFLSSALIEREARPSNHVTKPNIDQLQN